MLRKILESKVGTITDSKYAEVMDLTATDIRINEIYSKERTGSKQIVDIAVRCFIALGRGNVA